MRFSENGGTVGITNSLVNTNAATHGAGVANVGTLAAATLKVNNCTFTGSAMVCVAGIAALEVLNEELIARVRRIGDGFRQDLSQALSSLPLFREARGAGLIVGIQLRASDHPWLSCEHFGMENLADHPTTGVLLCHRLYKRGFFCFVCGHDWSVLRIQPRFNIEPEKLSEFARAAKEELEYLCNLV